MAKKNKIPFNRSERLLEVDSELDAAMEVLDETNQRVDGLLADFDKPDDDGGEEGAFVEKEATEGDPNPDAPKPEDVTDGEETPEDASAPE